MVNKPLIRRHFWGGYVGGGGRLTSHKTKRNKFCKKKSIRQIHGQPKSLGQDLTVFFALPKTNSKFAPEDRHVYAPGSWIVSQPIHFQVQTCMLVLGRWWFQISNLFWSFFTPDHSGKIGSTVRSAFFSTGKQQQFLDGEVTDYCNSLW